MGNAFTQTKHNTTNKSLLMGASMALQDLIQ